MPRRQALCHVGPIIRAARLRRCLTQRQLAVQSGLSVTGIAMIERGERQPRLDTIVRLAWALGVPLADVLLAS